MGISVIAIERLPKYLRILKKLKDENIKNVSSTTIANELRLNPIQVRKDLSYVSKTDGKPNIGFVVVDLIKDIEDYLGLNKSKDIIVVGAGRLGQALMNYSGFENDVNIVMAFDIDENKCDNKKIFSMSKIESLIAKKNIQIGIITVPKEEAQKICNLLVKNGIKVIWNFAPIHLNVPENIKIRNEDLSASLMMLLKELNREENKK